jgi:hypothetical protein
MDMHGDWERIKDKLIAALILADTDVDAGQIKIQDWGCPHEPRPLPEGKMAVYMFFHEGRCLKVGKAGPHSNTRYASQHYLPGAAKSNLADSILSDKKFLSRLSGSSGFIDVNNIGGWLKRKTHRINVLLDKTLGPFVLNFAEAFLQACFKPQYEGFKSQSRPQIRGPDAPREPSRPEVPPLESGSVGITPLRFKKNPAIQNRAGNLAGYITYENHSNPHVTIHINDGECTQIKKKGGGSTGGGKYTEHRTLNDAYTYARRTGLPLIKECSFCKKRYEVEDFEKLHNPIAKGYMALRHESS